MKKHTFDKYLKNRMKSPIFKKGFEQEKKKLEIGYQIFLAREKSGLTQSEMARRVGTKQSNISRLEQGNYNFTVEMLEKIAAALHAKLKIELIASQQSKAA